MFRGWRIGQLVIGERKEVRFESMVKRFGKGKTNLFFQTQTMPKVSHKVNRRYYFIIFSESTLRSPMLDSFSFTQL